MTVEVFDVEQGTEEWLRLRAGVPTASRFSDILAKGEGKTRRSYMLQLAGEILTGEPTETFKTPAMERGNLMEEAARISYAFEFDVKPERVGFVRNGRVGASPDSYVGKSGGLEIKTKRSDLLIDTILKDKVPPEHVAQIQGNLWVCEREWWDFVAYWPRLPLFVKRVYRDEAYISGLSRAVDKFLQELDETVAFVRAYG